MRVRDAIAGTLDAMTLADLVPVRHVPIDPRLATVAAPGAAALDSETAPTLAGATS